MEITLNLVLSVIVEAVKAETYIKGAIDRAAGGDQHATNGVAYHETAGDESVHERKIIRGIYTSADKLRSYIQDYLDVAGSSTADNNAVVISESADSIKLKLVVGERFNKANSDALARLSSKYIEDNTLVLWWGAINQQQAQFYSTLLVEDMSAIQRLFIKKAPSAPATTYTTSLTISGSTLEMAVEDDETITYTLSNGAVDDIDIVSSDPFIATGERNEGKLLIIAKHKGYCQMKVFSRHNDTLSKTINVTVKQEV